MKFSTKITIVVLVYVLITGLISVFYIPPFQKPDEIIHWYYALTVSSKDWQVEKRLAQLPEHFKASKIAFHDGIKFTGMKILYSDTNRETIDFSQYRYQLQNPISYLPAVIGIWLGQWSQYPAVSFWLGRLLGLLFFIGSILVSLKIISERYRGIIVVYAMLPMVIHQVSGINYDVMPLVLAPLILAFLVKMLESVKVNIWDFLVMVAALVMFLVAKGGYYVLLLLPVIILDKAFPKLLKKFWFVVIVAAPILAIYGFRLFYYLTIKYWGVGGGIVSPEMQYALLGQDKPYLIKIFWETLAVKWDLYIRSFLGYFGWLDYQYSLAGYLLVVGVALWVFLHFWRQNLQPIISKIGLLILWMTVVGEFGALMLFLYYSWSNVGAVVIEGMVGRYVLVLFPLTLFALMQTALFIGKDRFRNCLLVFVFGLIGFNTYKLINKRYYDFAGRYKNDKELVASIQKSVGEGGVIETVPLNKKISFLVGTGPDDEIAGFEVYVDSRNMVSRVPYRYQIKDRDCQKVYRDGYLDQEKLAGPDPVKEEFGVFTPQDFTLCVEFWPIATNGQEKYVSLGKIDDTFLFDFLIQEREEKY